MKKLQLIIASFITLFILGAVPAYAQPATSTQQVAPVASTSTSATGTDTPGQCGSTKTQLISCNATTGVGTISALIKLAVDVLSALIGVVAVAAIAYGAVLYASARDSQTQVSNAVGIIRNVIIGLVLYVFTIAIINWLIPGGVIGAPSDSSAAGTTTNQSSTTGSSTPSQ